MTFPPIMKAAKLLRACKDVSNKYVRMLTNCLDLEYNEVHTKAEDMIKQFVQNQTGFTKKDRYFGVKLARTDFFGNNLSFDEDNHEEVAFRPIYSRSLKQRRIPTSFQKLRKEKVIVLGITLKTIRKMHA